MVGVIVDILSGILFICLGYSLSVKGNIRLIHSYHYKKVTDKAGYTKNMGIGCYILGVGLLIVAVVNYLGYIVMSGYLTFAVIIIGLLWMLKTQMKYNGSIF